MLLGIAVGIAEKKKNTLNVIYRKSPVYGSTLSRKRQHWPCVNKRQIMVRRAHRVCMRDIVLHSKQQMASGPQPE